MKEKKEKKARLDISVVGLQETRRAGRTEFAAAGFRVFCCGSEASGHHGVGLAVKESICSNSTYTTEYVDERLMAMRFEISGQSGAINFISAYAPTEVTEDETKQAFWDRLDSLVQRIPAKECLYVLMDANARTGRRIEGESLQDEGIRGTYGRDELNDNGKLLLYFATDNKLAIMNTFFSTRKGRVLHTYNGVTGSRTSDFKRIVYVLMRQAHRRRVRNVVVHPQPALPAKADSDHNMVIATDDLGGRIAQPRHTGQAEAAAVQPTGVAGRNVAVARGREVPTQPWRANGPAKYHSTEGREGVHRSYPRSSADSASDRETDTTYAGVV